MHTNRLSHQKSPYLLQHAHNPVDWYPWGPEAFQKARDENKPIFLSVGYSTCHWCHVMERESFENQGVAEILNRDFVAIKVDREERPDVDRIYMTFVQATGGSGGWPMSVWLTPDLEPFFGGTYFPPENRYGHPGFSSVLTQVAAAWKDHREQVVESGHDILRQLQQSVAVTPARPGAPAVDAAALAGCFFAFRRIFDARLGGFGGAPKFPRPSVHNFLLRHWARTRNQEALDMVLLTLRKMAAGGMRDQIGGGFHRYSVDERWFVPHFEKMLYDQAQLAISYLEAFQITGDALYSGVARSIFDYVLRDMTSPEGGFYSAEDADSASDPARPGEKSEGAFYVWSAEEVRAAIGSPAADWLLYRYGAAEDGNVAHDPHGEFGGKNILFEAHTVEETAQRFSVAPGEIHAAAGALLAARAKRPRPHLDDKILAAWNGLMISAFALGGSVLAEPLYADAARRAAEFLATRLWDEPSGVLCRRYRGGETAIPGFLDDYTMAAQGLLDLYEAQLDHRHFELARRLTDKQAELFEDAAHGGFFTTAGDDPSLVLRVKDDYDGAEPSGNSVAVMNLLRLGQMTGEARYRASAERALSAFWPRMSTVALTLPQMLAACEFYISEPRQIVFVGERDAADLAALRRALDERFLPNKVVLLVDSEETRRALAAGAPSIAAMQKLQGRASAYVCRDYACQLPVFEARALAELLQ